MNSSAMQYVGFIVAAIILIWAVLEINRRYFRRNKGDVKSLDTWVQLDTSQPDATEESVPGDVKNEEADDAGEQPTQTRARQNGHYSESKKPL